MIRYLIKNYLKMMFRNPVNILLFTVAPLILVAVLSSAFSSMMDSYERAETFTVGYSVAKGSEAEAYMQPIAEIFNENKIEFKEYSDGDPEELLYKEDLAGFIQFSKDDYVISKRIDMVTEGKIIEYTIASFMRNADSYKLGMVNVSEPEISVEYPDHAPVVDATDYYGKIEIVYFLWCGFICASFTVGNEKKFKIYERLRMSGISEARLYLAKVLPAVAVVYITTIIGAVFSTVFFGTKWGNFGLSALIIGLMVVAALTSEFMIYYICNNIPLTVMISFMTVWFAGFYGGSFENYIYSSHSEKIKLLSPLYHGNRALVELASSGKSDFVKSTIIFSLVMIVVSSAIAIIAGNIRRRRAC